MAVVVTDLVDGLSRLVRRYLYIYNEPDELRTQFGFVVVRLRPM